MATKKEINKKPKEKKVISRILVLIKWVLVFFFGSTLFVVVVFRFINPPITPLMIYRTGSQLFSGEKMTLKKQWISIEDVSPSMIRAVIASEDNLFVTHWGIDTKAIKTAVEHNKKSRTMHGASTISQQTAKNVFLWPSRNYIRKAFEFYFTLLIEGIWGKERIMEVYLNVIETGKGIYGVEMASQIYFSKSSARITPGQAALIAGSLPSPLKMNPAQPSTYLMTRQAWILSKMHTIQSLKIGK